MMFSRTHLRVPKRQSFIISYIHHSIIEPSVQGAGGRLASVELATVNFPGTVQLASLLGNSQWLGFHPSIAGGMDSIPGGGTKILQAKPRRHSQKQEKTCKMCLILGLLTPTGNSISVHLSPYPTCTHPPRPAEGPTGKSSSLDDGPGC